MTTKAIKRLKQEEYKEKQRRTKKKQKKKQNIDFMLIWWEIVVKPFNYEKSEGTVVVGK